jgi:hypothetical protein
MTLYKKCDLNGDGRISFDEFLRYIYKQEKTADGRHARLAQAGAATDDGTEGDWGPCERVFVAFAGEDMDNREFMKFCKDTKLIGGKFKNTDVDLCFSQVCRKSRRMNFDMFKDGCRLIAKKRGTTTGFIQGVVADSAGPNLVGTKADAVRFHDDKSTYTGSHTYNEKHAGADQNHEHMYNRHEQMQKEKQDVFDAMADQEDDWGECERVFNAFSGMSGEPGEMDGDEFQKMCHQIDGLLRGGFKTNDIDTVFSAHLPRGQRKIRFEHFKNMVREIALKKQENVFVTQKQFARNKGPQLRDDVTKAEYNKFHDDKSLYTGVQAEVFEERGLA